MITTLQPGWFEQIDAVRRDDPGRCYRVLVADLVGLQLDDSGEPNCSAFVDHVEARGARFSWGASEEVKKPGIVFEYHPDISREQDLIALAGVDQFDSVIAAATHIPSSARFSEGGVRIGAGTANMASRSFTSGAAPLMNTPGLNSRATAQMVFKALLRVRPNLPLNDLHNSVSESRFDTGLNLREFPTRKLEGLRFAVLGFGNIGREVALLAQAFGMQVAVYAREPLKPWVEAEGFEHCATPERAAARADVISLHLGLGAKTDSGYANEGVVNASVLAALADDSVVINFDRGELVNIDALAEVVASGKVGQVAVDADIFLSGGETEKCNARGPLAAYLPLLDEHSDRVLLLPHAAADTDHPSRVAGALQAADQIIAAIRYGVVANGVGTLPAGYTSAGSQKPRGIGRVSRQVIDSLAQDEFALTELRAQLATVDEWLNTLQAKGPANSGGQPTRQGLLALNALLTTTRTLGLVGPGPEL